jgi:hypothetical protein
VRAITYRTVFRRTIVDASALAMNLDNGPYRICAQMAIVAAKSISYESTEMEMSAESSLSLSV